MKAVMIVHEV